VQLCAFDVLAMDGGDLRTLPFRCARQISQRAASTCAVLPFILVLALGLSLQKVQRLLADADLSRECLLQPGRELPSADFR